MLRTILKSLGTKMVVINPIRTARFLVKGVIEQDKKEIKLTNLNEINKSTAKLSNDQIGSTQFTKQMRPLGHISRVPNEKLIESLSNVDNIEKLFNILRPCVDCLSSNQLSSVYGRIWNLSVMYRNNSNKGNSNRPWTQFIETVKSSPVFERLICRTINLDGKLCCEALLNAFIVFDRLGIDPNRKEVKIVIKNIQQNLCDLKFIQILQFIDTYQSYSRQACYPDGLYSSLYITLIDVAKSNIINDEEFDRNNVPQLMKAFKVFSRNVNFNIVKKLISLLLLPQNQFNLISACKLLNIIKTVNKERPKEFALFESLALNKLIDKCNTTICEHLKENSNDVWYYLKRLHQTRTNSSRTLKDLFPNSILDLVVPILIEDARNDHIIHKFAENYAIFHKYDDRLLRYVYHAYRTKAKERAKLCIGQLNLLTKLRVPFVDVSKVIEILFTNNSQQIYSTITNDSAYGLQLINTLLLNDMSDGENLWSCLNYLKSNLKKTSFKKLPYNTFKEFCLSRIYFSLFSEMDYVFERKINERLDELFKLVSEVYQPPKVNYQSTETQIKLMNGYLSNGLYLETFFILCKSTRCLVPLSVYKNNFHAIDKIPLNEGQELCAIIWKPRFEGNIDRQYELNANYRFRQVLNKLKIKSIDVFTNDFINLSDEEKEKFIIENSVCVNSQNI